MSLTKTNVKQLAEKYKASGCSKAQSFGNYCQVETRIYPTKKNLSTQTCCHLMSKTSAAAVNHYTDLTCFFNSHFASIKLIVDLVNNLYLSIVVTSAERAKLPQSAHESSDITAVIQRGHLQSLRNFSD